MILKSIAARAWRESKNPAKHTTTSHLALPSLSDVVIAQPGLGSSPFWLHSGGMTFPLQSEQQSHSVISIFSYKSFFPKSILRSPFISESVLFAQQNGYFIALLSNMIILWLQKYSLSEGPLGRQFLTTELYNINNALDKLLSQGLHISGSDIVQYCIALAMLLRPWGLKLLPK